MAPGRRNIWGEWSEWTWDEDQVRYWRARQDIQGKTGSRLPTVSTVFGSTIEHSCLPGNVQYDYSVPDTAGQTGQAAPRGNVEDLSDALSAVNLGGQDANYTQNGGAYTYRAPVIAGGVLPTPLLPDAPWLTPPHRFYHCVWHISCPGPRCVFGDGQGEAC